MTRSAIERRLRVLESRTQTARRGGTIRVPPHATPAQIDGFMAYLHGQMIEQGMQAGFVVVPSLCSIESWPTVVERELEAIYAEL
jgi:hypothetical protein